MKPIILVGNDINNINNDLSWGELLQRMIAKFEVNVDLDNLWQKPFPLLYEEIYVKSIQRNDYSEYEIKQWISDNIRDIQANEIHDRITSGTFSDILTTNYDYTLEKSLSRRANHVNQGLIKESKFSVFRKHRIKDIDFWHIHGDVGHPNSILLGYEQYNGQTQQMRNYVVTGTDYKRKIADFKPLINRFGSADYEPHSWIDYFFSREIHIMGLSLDFIESDLWWLFTLRARKKFEKGREEDKFRAFKERIYGSSITYYYPSKYYNKEKMQLMEANDIKTVAIDEDDKLTYYHQILNLIER